MPRYKRRRRRRERKPDEPKTIEEFCESNRISESMYFVMKRKGQGPREMRIGKRVLISPEAEAEWRHERESSE